jgi:hypothetical protein
MLVSVILLQTYNGVSAGYETSLPKEIAIQLIEEGKAVELNAEKPLKVEPKKVGK